ncbi:hypothetical protein HDU88_000623 [Geranomyces variabilis]|nr:hypothetical protein HDU88_000623 [Geranomyces variabilis]
MAHSNSEEACFTVQANVFENLSFEWTRGSAPDQWIGTAMLPANNPIQNRNYHTAYLSPSAQQGDSSADNHSVQFLKVTILGFVKKTLRVRAVLSVNNPLREVRQYDLHFAEEPLTSFLVGKALREVVAEDAALIPALKQWTQLPHSQPHVWQLSPPANLEFLRSLPISNLSAEQRDVLLCLLDPKCLLIHVDAHPGSGKTQVLGMFAMARFLQICATCSNPKQRKILIVGPTNSVCDVLLKRLQQLTATAPAIPIQVANPRTSAQFGNRLFPDLAYYNLDRVMFEMAHNKLKNGEVELVWPNGIDMPNTALPTPSTKSSPSLPTQPRVRQQRAPQGWSPNPSNESQPRVRQQKTQRRVGISHWLGLFKKLEQDVALVNLDQANWKLGCACLEREILQTSDVLVCTPHMYHAWVPKLIAADVYVDTVIADEASRFSEAELLSLLTHHTQKITLFGDRSADRTYNTCAQRQQTTVVIQHTGKVAHPKERCLRNIGQKPPPGPVDIRHSVSLFTERASAHRLPAPAATMGGDPDKPTR